MTVWGGEATNGLLLVQTEWMTWGILLMVGAKGTREGVSSEGLVLVATMKKMPHVIHSVWTNNKPFVDYTANNQKEA